MAKGAVKETLVDTICDNIKRDIINIEEFQTIENTSSDLSGKTVAELRELAKEKEIKGYSTMKKAELLEALK